MICNKYDLLEKIGQGAFSQIYKGRNIRTGELVAIKIEPKTAEIKLLQNETRMYQYLHSFNKSQIPEIKWFGVDTENYYMVISLLGKSLESFKREQPNGRAYLFDTLHLGIKMIMLVESIHKRLLIHRDIKPDNFLFGLESSVPQAPIHLIDFGFCTKYRNHFTPTKTSNIIGTPKFASISAHEFNELSRRDDLESVGYILIYLYMGELAWDKITDNDEIKSMKLRMIHGEDPTIPHVFIDYLRNVRNIAFYETPNYATLISRFSGKP